MFFFESVSTSLYGFESYRLFPPICLRMTTTKREMRFRKLFEIHQSSFKNISPTLNPNTSEIETALPNPYLCVAAVKGYLPKTLN